MSNTTYVILETHTGAMDGQYLTREKAESIRGWLEERWEGTSWIVLAASKPERDHINRDRKVMFPNNYLAHEQEYQTERLKSFTESYRKWKASQAE